LVFIVGFLFLFFLLSLIIVFIFFNLEFLGRFFDVFSFWAGNFFDFSSFDTIFCWVDHPDDPCPSGSEISTRSSASNSNVWSNPNLDSWTSYNLSNSSVNPNSIEWSRRGGLNSVWGTWSGNLNSGAHNLSYPPWDSSGGVYGCQAYPAFNCWDIHCRFHA